MGQTVTINACEHHCGSCRYMDQRHSGTHRYCSVMRSVVPANSLTCARYKDIWEKDIFGNTLYSYMKEKGLAV